MYDSLKAKNAKRFSAVKLTKSFSTTVKKMLANKARYQAVEKKTGVPWPVIAAIHVREADMSFSTQLAQGDPLSRVSSHVPRGQGPYFGADAWERAAARALIETGGSKWGDWTPGGWTTYTEVYNGLGYANKGRPSPYVWAGTNQYSSGKYVSDGQYSSTAVDTQPGTANLIVALAALDPTINTQDLTAKIGIGPKVTTGTVATTGAVVAVAAQPHLWPWIVGGLVAIIAALILVYYLEE